MSINALLNVSLLLTLVGTIIFVVASVIYNKDILKGASQPNVVTWSLFVLITLINATSYVSMTGDVVKSFLAFTDLAVCTVITLLILSKGDCPKTSIVEKMVIAFSLTSISAWALLQSATYANVLLQPGYICAFIPTFVNAYKNPSAEKPLPWFMWASSFVLSIIVVVMRWEEAWEDLLNPSIALLLHIGVGSLALRRSTK